MQYKNTLHIKTVQYTIQNIQNTLKEYNMQQETNIIQENSAIYVT